MPDRTITITLRAPVAQSAVMALSKEQHPTPEESEGRDRLKQGLLDAGWGVDSDQPIYQKGE